MLSQKSRSRESQKEGGEKDVRRQSKRHPRKPWRARDESNGFGVLVQLHFAIILHGAQHPSTEYGAMSRASIGIIVAQIEGE